MFVIGQPLLDVRIFTDNMYYGFRVNADQVQQLTVEIIIQERFYPYDFFIHDPFNFRPTAKIHGYRSIHKVRDMEESLYFWRMQVTARAISELLGGTLEGDPNVLIHGPSKIEEGEPGTISFIGNPKYELFAYTTRASALLVSKDFQPKSPVKATLIRVDNVYEAIGQLINKYAQSDDSANGISDLAMVSPEASVAPDASVGAFAVVEAGAIVASGARIHPQAYVGSKVKIGRGTVVYPGVRIYKDCIIGEECIIHANAVIGSDGFGFTKDEHGAYQKVSQIGNVVIEDRVEIGSQTVIDRAVMGSTIIRTGCKLDNLIQIAHNVEIGAHTVIAAQAGIAGSTRLGPNCMVGGQVGIVGHLQIPAGTQIQAQSGVTSAGKEENGKLYGSPAMDYGQFLRSYAAFKNLPDTLQRIRSLEQELKKLKESQSS